MYIFMHIYVYLFVLRILNRKIHILFCTLTSFLVFLISALPFSVSCYIFFSLTLLRVHFKHYTPYPSVRHMCIIGTSILSSVNQVQEFNINNNAFIYSPYSNFICCSVGIFFSITGSSPVSCCFIMTP